MIFPPARCGPGSLPLIRSLVPSAPASAQRAPRHHSPKPRDAALRDGAVVDDFASVVNADAARSMAAAVGKHCRAARLARVVLATSDAALVPWLQPDWVISLPDPDSFRVISLPDPDADPRPDPDGAAASSANAPRRPERPSTRTEP